ncbi:hypothetical protein Tco_0535465 [Tanacetum coccineum]
MSQRRKQKVILLQDEENQELLAEEHAAIWDEASSTIPETESDELIKSSVENLVPTPSESEDLSKDLSDIESECNVPVCDDFTTVLYPSLMLTMSFLVEFNSKNSDAIIESFSPSPIPVEDSDSLMEEIDLFLTPDDSMPPGIENDDYDSEGDILFLEELLSNDSPSLPENESFHFDVPSSPRPPAKPPDDDEIEPDMRVLTTKWG